jgi:hypothetical protein
MDDEIFLLEEETGNGVPAVTQETRIEEKN